MSNAPGEEGDIVNLEQSLSNGVRPQALVVRGRVVVLILLQLDDDLDQLIRVGGGHGASSFRGSLLRFLRLAARPDERASLDGSARPWGVTASGPGLGQQGWLAV